MTSLNAHFSHRYPLRSRMIRAISAATLACVVCFASVARAGIPTGYDIIGPIDVQNRYQRPQVAVYVELAPMQGFHLLAQHTDAQAASLPTYDTRRPLALLRVDDPTEQSLYHRIVDTIVNAADYPDLVADDLAGGVLIDKGLISEKSGLYTIRMGAGYEFSNLSIGVPPGSPYGISYSNGVWQEWRAAPAPLWVWIPGHPKKPVHVEFQWASGSLTVTGVDVAFSKTLDSANTSVIRDLPAGSAGELLKLEGMSANWQFRAGGDVPIIAATTAEFAKKLDASLWTVASGPMAGERVPHLFQKRMLEEHLPALLAGVGDGKMLADLSQAKVESTACKQVADVELARKGITLMSWELPAVAATLDTWTFGAGAPKFADLPGYDAMAPVLSYVASRYHPCNPWGPSAPDGKDGRAELINRAAISLILQMLDVTEDERLITGGDVFNTYPGGAAAFDLYYRAKPFALLAPLLPDYLPAPLGVDLQKALAEGIRRIALDRRYTAGFTSTANQTSHLVPSIASLTRVPGLPVIPTATKAYADRFAVSANPSGWFEEDSGPDATYNGITHFELAAYYLMSSWTSACTDQTMRAAIQKSYSYFNATVGPEPNGRILGGFNYSHRTDWGFYAEQYGGAREIARDIPEVAIWTDPVPNLTITDLQTNLATEINLFAQRRTQFSNPPAVANTPFHFLRLLASETFDYPKQHKDLSWPAQDPAFDHKFGEDLYAVRRNGYFASFYIGTTASIGNTAKLTTLKYINRVTPGAECPDLYVSNWEDTGMVMPAFKSKPLCSTGPIYMPVMPLTGGGITTLWTPESGVAIMSANWSPLVHHGLVGRAINPVSGADERTWEDYVSVKQVAANRDGVEMSGRLPRYFEAPATESLSYTRKYTLTDDALNVDVTLTNAAAAPVTFTSLWENLPFPVCDKDCGTHYKGRKIGFVDASGAPLASGDYSLNAVRVVDEFGHGLAIEFASPQPVRIRPVGLRQVRYDENLQIGRIELPFPMASLAAGQTMSMAYKIRTLEPIASVTPIVAVTDTPQVVCGPALSGAGGGGGNGGNGGAGGAGGNGGASNDDAGCGCRVSGSSSSSAGAALAMLALAYASRRRHKRS